jgi:hypothetical protein
MGSPGGIKQGVDLLDLEGVVSDEKEKSLER